MEPLYSQNVGKWAECALGGCLLCRKGDTEGAQESIYPENRKFHQFSNWFRWTSTYPLNIKNLYFGQLPQKLLPPPAPPPPPPSMASNTVAVTPIPSCPHSSPSSCSSSHPQHLMTITAGQNPQHGLPSALAMKTLEEPNIPILCSTF